MNKNLNITFLLVLSFFACKSQSINDLDFLIGTWKVEGKETYEVWEREGTDLKGSSYKIKNGAKVVTETLALVNRDGEITYYATVQNQNDGKPVAFTLNTEAAKGYSFENPAHDFPTKIIYQKVSATEMVVHVLGPDDKGFSLKFAKL